MLYSSSRANHPVHLAILVLFFALTPTSTRGAEATTDATPNAEAFVDRVLTALGGRDAWNAVQSLEATGTYSAFSAELPFRLIRQRPNLYRFEHAIGGAPVTVGYDGEEVWWECHLPFVPVPWASSPPLPYQRGIEADAEFLYPFLDPARRGHLEYGGETEFEGMAVHQLKVPLDNGVIETWYFDRQSLLPVARLSVAGFKDFEAENRIFFSDFRPVEGIQLPFHVEHEADNLVGFLQVDTIQVNPPLDAKLFDPPKPEILRTLEDLAGQWDVRVEVKPLPHLPWMPSTGRATIARLPTGQGIKETISFISMGIERTIERFYTHNRFADRFEMVQVDSLTNHLDLFVGAPDGATISAENTTTGTAWAARGPSMPERFLLNPNPDGGFLVEWSRSPDGGQQWIPHTRLTYSRSD